ncbi:polyadenylate-binding protein RBP47-like [Andrographis paniculata]|uniref:polyadenylate-binding protein RBP47-like n=1 Tax=Andrographis paniculata TaxID=175694 RepID=UPI0021E79005|nr:polyadenylate-binding protein RBP47-like [Andrographis paniculata]
MKTWKGIPQPPHTPFSLQNSDSPNLYGKPPALTSPPPLSNSSNFPSNYLGIVMEANSASESQQQSTSKENNGNNNNNSNSNSNGNGNNNSNESGAKAVFPIPVAAPVPGHQWMTVPYQPAMVMPHGMIPAPPHYASHYMPYNHPLHHPPAMPHHPPLQTQSVGNGGGSNGENRTIWVGDLHSWMDEDYLRSCFATIGGISSIKVIRNKQTGLPEGYGFVEFSTHASAENVLQTYTHLVMPNTDQLFRLNWAAFSMGEKRSSNGSDLSIFVGDLAADVTDSLLHETFANKYPSVKAAKVVFDPNTGRSKGYGFVRFGDEHERSKAMNEMNGLYCSSRPMRIGAAAPRKSSAYQQQYSSQGGYSNGTMNHGSQSDGDSVNTTIFVGGLDPSVTDEDLRQPFSQYGEILSVKIPVGKGCGFVQFANRNDAEDALQQLSGTTIGKQTVRLSWGRNPANKQSRSDYVNHWMGAYYGGPFFDGYGYPVPAPHDPSMYAAAAATPVYGAYPFFGTHQQQVS